MQVLFGNRKIAAAQILKFWGLTIDTTFTWKHHIGELISRLIKACYAFRSIKLFMSLDVLRSTYFSYAHSIISFFSLSLSLGATTPIGGCILQPLASFSLLAYEVS